MAVDYIESGRDFIVLPSAARTAAPNDQQFVAGNRYRGITVVIDVTAIVTAPSITVTVNAVDRASGKAYALLASTAITTVSTTVLQIDPALTAAANSKASASLPSTIRVTVTHANGNSITYSIGASLTY